MERAPVVLIIEDDADLRELSQSVLESAGIRVIVAADGKRGMRALDLMHVDAIVLDMMMPELDGLAFLRQYACREAPRAPIIAVSAFAAYLDEARLLGAVATLAKPYRARELVDHVRTVAAGRTPPAVNRRPETTLDEEARLRALFDLDLDRPAHEPGMQRFLDELAAVFAVPVCGISAVTADRQQLVTHCSAIPGDEGGPREQAFCTHAVVARAALVIQDALENPFFRDNPSVTVRGFRFYAGVPLIAARGEAVGTLCILDYEPHPFTHLDLELLGLFSRRVLATLERRDRQQHPDAPESAYQHLHELDRELDIYGKALFEDLAVVVTSRSLLRGEPATLVAASVPRARMRDAVDALRARVRGGFVGRLGRDRIGVVVCGMQEGAADELVRAACGHDAVVASTPLDRYAGGAGGLALAHVEQELDAAASSGAPRPAQRST